MRFFKDYLPHFISIAALLCITVLGWHADVNHFFLITYGIAWIFTFIMFSGKLYHLNKVIDQAFHFFSTEVKVENKHQALLEAIRMSQAKLEVTASQIRHISVLREAQPIHSLIAKDAIGIALHEVQLSISRLKRAETHRQWIAEGLSQFAELIRVKDDTNTFCSRMISHLVKYTGANQGGFFLWKDDAEGQYLELAACYAYERERFLQKRIYPGQGLLGQCAFERDIIFLTDVPHDYIKITSGLGLSTPRNIAVIPLMIHQKFYGALELALFDVLADYQISFLKEVSESLAAELDARQSLETTNRLLSDSLKLTHELQASEAETKKKQAALNSYLNAINNTIATAEFDMQGKFISANDIFLKIMGYSHAEISLQRYHTLMADMAASNIMWDNLREGKSFAGEFKMRDKGGKEKWLNGTFNPIFIQGNHPETIMMCAQFNTEEKEKLHDLNVMVNALKSCLPILEVTDTFKCKSANEKFMKMFNVSRLELRNKTLHDFVDVGYSDFFDSIKTEILQKDNVTLVLPFYKDGNQATYEVTISVVKDSSGVLSRLIIILVRELEQRIPVLTAVR